MNERINSILKFLDKCLTVEKVEIDSRGMYGTHYEGLILDVYFEDSILSIDYLNIEDYFLTTINYNYKDYLDISNLNKDIIIHRITGDPNLEKLVEPKWTGRKKIVLNSINNALNKLDIAEGDKKLKFS